MNINEKIEKRLDELVSQGESLRTGDAENDTALDENHLQRCSGWIAASRNLTQIIMPNTDSLYRLHIEEIATKDHGWTINQSVGEITELLKNLLTDFNLGLLTSVINQTRAEVFDDFLDHARWYIGKNKKNEAGVITGVVFEDTIRRICKNNSISEVGEKLDNMISALTKNGVISSVMAKRARVGAHVRTKATHAQWEEFELGDVETTIAFTDELILKHLDGQT